MIVKKEQIPQEKVAHLFKGDGYVLVEELLADEVLPPKARKFAVYTLQPKCCVGKHFHVGETQMVYCIQGGGRIDDNGTVAQLEAGDAAYCPSGEYHSVENTGNEPMRFLVLSVLDPATGKEDGPVCISSL